MHIPLLEKFSKACIIGVVNIIKAAWTLEGIYTPARVVLFRHIETIIWRPRGEANQGQSRGPGLTKQAKQADRSPGRQLLCHRLYVTSSVSMRFGWMYMSCAPGTATLHATTRHMHHACMVDAGVAQRDVTRGGRWIFFSLRRVDPIRSVDRSRTSMRACMHHVHAGP
jgi:hypothetical protein